MSNDIYYLVYKTTHLNSGRFYIGRHVTSNLDDGYLGSGTAFRKFLKAHSPLEFKREILHLVPTSDDMIQLEIEEIEKSLDHPLCLNCIVGDPSRTGVIKHSIETRAKMSASAKVKIFTEEHRRNIGLAGLGRKNSPEHIEKTRQGHLGSKRSVETKAKIKEKRANQDCSTTWTIQDPSGNIIVTKMKLKEFCKERKLGLSKLRDTQQTKKPVESGFSTGWLIVSKV